MKTALLLLTIILNSFIVDSQVAESKACDLVREEMKMQNQVRYSYKNVDWDHKFRPAVNDLGYDLIDMSIDTAKIYPIVRQVISPIYYLQLNKGKWYVHTKITGYGKIVSISFLFKDESGVNCSEFAILSARFKKNVGYKLTFNQVPKDTFYLQLSFPGPKL